MLRWDISHPWTPRGAAPIRSRLHRSPSPNYGALRFAQVAQLVEHATENRSVGGSIPSLGTISTSEDQLPLAPRMIGGLPDPARRQPFGAAGDREPGMLGERIASAGIVDIVEDEGVARAA